MTGQTVGSAWPSGSPPPAADGLRWELHDVAELPGLRTQLRHHLDQPAVHGGRHSAELRDQMVLAFDEMASNALRHGGGQVAAAVRLTETHYLIEVSDSAATTPPRPAVGRDPSEGGLGLYLIAELATDHGWYSHNGRKHVWALLPRD